MANARIKTETELKTAFARTYQVQVAANEQLVGSYVREVLMNEGDALIHSIRCYLTCVTGWEHPAWESFNVLVTNQGRMTRTEQRKGIYRILKDM